MPKILYNFPSRERPEKLIKSIENIISLSRHDDYVIGLTLDVDDSSCANREFHDRLLSYGERVKPVYGFSKGKIDAVNKNVWLYTDADIICTQSDDMVFTKEGFDLDIIEGYSDGFSGLLHFPDGHANANLITYAIMDRAYYDLFNYIYHPEFCSVYADNLQMDIAKKMKRYKYVDKQILRHEHAIWGYGEKDTLLLKTEDPVNYANDHKIYIRLKKEMGL